MCKVGECLECMQIELNETRDDKLKLEIAARDFLRATDMHGLLTQAEFNAARDTLAAIVNKGDE